jgi:hypothetical protein
MEVSGQLHTPIALPAEKEAPVPTGQEVKLGPKAGLDVVERETSLTSAGK